jgi:hypothetical protein
VIDIVDAGVFVRIGWIVIAVSRFLVVASGYERGPASRDQLPIPIAVARSRSSMNAFPLGVAPCVLKKVRDRNRFLVPIGLAGSHTEDGSRTLDAFAVSERSFGQRETA